MGSLSEDTLRYLDAHAHLLPRSQNRRAPPPQPSAAARARAASLRRSVRAAAPTHVFTPSQPINLPVLHHPPPVCSLSDILGLISQPCFSIHSGAASCC